MNPGEVAMKAHQRIEFLEDKTLSVVGGTGGMGKLFAKIFKDYVKEVVVCSRTFKKAEKVANKLDISAWPIEKCAEADIVLVSVPIEETYRVCNSIIRKMAEKTLLMELSSVKCGIVDKLTKDLEDHKIEYLSLHPLFGPVIRNVKERRIVIIPGKTGPISEKVIEFLKRKNALIIKSNSEEHDRSMALMQAAHHFAFLTLLSTLKKYPLKNTLEKFQTESFKRTNKTLKMISKNLNTIMAIQKMNPYAEDFRGEFIENAKNLERMDDDSQKLISDVFKKNGIK